MGQVVLAMNHDFLVTGRPLQVGKCRFCDEPIVYICYANDTSDHVRFLCDYHGSHHGRATLTNTDKLWTAHRLRRTRG